jgi:hypothetical protein
MKKLEKKIIYFTMFEYLGTLNTAFDNFLNILVKEFDKVIIVNSENLAIFKKNTYYNKNKLIFKKFNKNIIFFNPINYEHLNDSIDFKNSVVVHNMPMTFNYFRLKYFFARKKVHQIVIANTGNIQASVYYFWKKNFNFIFFYLKRELPKKISVLLSSLGIFSKIDIRFTSNKKLYKNFYDNKEKFFSKPTIYKEIVLVKSIHFDHVKITKKSNDYITLIDFDPDYYHATESIGVYNKKKLSEHYANTIRLLKKLKNLYKKKIIICIHPSYNIKKISKIYKGFDVVKFKTKEFIAKSFLVMFYDSSSILDAMFLKKKIIALRSDLMFGHKHASDTYTDIISFKKINISKEIKINKNKLIIELNNKINLYNKYFNLYASADLKNDGDKEIIKTINKRFF